MSAAIALRNVVGEAEHVFLVESFHCIASSIWISSRVVFR